MHKVEKSVSQGSTTPSISTAVVDIADTGAKNDIASGVISDFAIKEVRVSNKEQDVSDKIDQAAVAKNSIESDRDYRKITSQIIEISEEQLKDHTKDKKPLRLILMWFVIILLILQFGALVAILFLNKVWELEISNEVIKVYVVSLFAETLSGLFIMIKFAFDTSQEVRLIAILNNIVERFKKYDEK
jgi:6-pyruvoyl-tetrahydropterin synthase